MGAPQQSRKERAEVRSWYFYNWVNYFVISTCLRGRAHLLCHPGPDHLLHEEKSHFPLGVELGLERLGGSMLPERLRLLLGSPLALCQLASMLCAQPGHLQIAPTANTWAIPAGPCTPSKRHGD